LSSGLINSKNVRFLSGILPPEFYSIENKAMIVLLDLNVLKISKKVKDMLLKMKKLFF